MAQQAHRQLHHAAKSEHLEGEFAGRGRGRAEVSVLVGAVPGGEGKSEDLHREIEGLTRGTKEGRRVGHVAEGGVVGGVWGKLLQSASRNAFSDGVACFA